MLCSGLVMQRIQLLANRLRIIPVGSRLQLRGDQWRHIVRVGVVVAAQIRPSRSNMGHRCPSDLLKEPGPRGDGSAKSCLTKRSEYGARTFLPAWQQQSMSWSRNLTHSVFYCVFPGSVLGPTCNFGGGGSGRVPGGAHKTNGTANSGQSYHEYWKRDCIVTVSYREMLLEDDPQAVTRDMPPHARHHA